MTNPASSTDDTAQIPWATTPTTNAASAPALNPPTWSGRKTAIAAALAIGVCTMRAVAAAAALPPRSLQGGQGQVQRGGFGPGGQQFPAGAARGRSRRAAYRRPAGPKDFGTIPVCGSVRPLASQQARACDG